jgi:hypothetical protein
VKLTKNRLTRRFDRAPDADMRHKLQKIVVEVKECGHANLTRLTVLKKWFGPAHRLRSKAVIPLVQIVGLQRTEFVEARRSSRLHRVHSIPANRGFCRFRSEEMDQSLTGINLLRSGDDRGREHRKVLKLLGDWSDKIDSRYVYEFTNGANCNLDLAGGNGRHSPVFDLAGHLSRDIELRKQFSVRLRPVVLRALIDFERSSMWRNASTVLMSGLGVPARTATPSRACARSTALAGMLLPSTRSSPSPSLLIMTTSAAAPPRSCARMVSGPLPCEAKCFVETVITKVHIGESSPSQIDRLKAEISNDPRRERIWRAR